MNSVFALSVSAEAGQGNDFPEGERRELLVLVQASSIDEAVSEAQSALSAKSWLKGSVHQSAPLTVALSDISDLVLREAARRASIGDRSIIVYDAA